MSLFTGVSLPDQYVVLLQNVVEENRLLREQMATTITNSENALKSLNEKIESMATSNVERRVRHTRPTIPKVPKPCSNNVRRKIKALRSAEENLYFKLDESPESEQNARLFSRVVQELHHEYGGQENCPRSVVVLKEAFKRYYKSCKAKDKRVATGQEEKHVKSCSRRSRKEEKLARRLKQLNQVHWSQEKVHKVAEVMRMEYMFSEESELEEETQRVKHYNVRKLSWGSRELKRAKKKLDRYHGQSLPGLTKRIVKPRKQGRPSLKQKPANCPDWACLADDEAPQVEMQDNGNDTLEDLNVSR